MFITYLKFCQIVFFGFYISNVKALEVSGEETINTCIAQSIPDSVLQLLVMAAQQTLQASGGSNDEIIEVKEKLSLMTEDLSAVLEWVKKQKDVATEASDDKSSEMLDSILNLLTSNNQLITNVNDNHKKNKNSIVELAIDFDLQNGKNENQLNEITKTILQSINQTRVDCTCDKSVSSPESMKTDDFSLISAVILDGQNETHALLKEILEETRAQKDAFKEQVASLIAENDILKTKTDTKTSILSRPFDCQESQQLSDNTKSGITTIYPHSCKCASAFRVWCDQENLGGGWTSIVVRGMRGLSQNFTRSWDDYERGFGDANGDYWIGNTILHQMTSSRRYSLLLEVTDLMGRKRWAKWNHFRVYSAHEKYRLSVGEYSFHSTLGDVLKTHNEQYFTTLDQDNDSSYDANCGLIYGGGWWYNKCVDILPTGSLKASGDARKEMSTGYFNGRKRMTKLKSLVFKMKPTECAQSNALTENEKCR